MPAFISGSPRLKLLNADGSTAKVLWLPPTSSSKGTQLEWEEVDSTKDMPGGWRLVRRKGFLPTLTLRWNGYNDVHRHTNRPIGSADGYQADFATLLALLDAAYGLLRVSPGPGAGGFTVNETKISPFGSIGPQGIPENLEITLKGGFRKIFAAKVLEVF